MQSWHTLGQQKFIKTHRMTAAALPTPVWPVHYVQLATIGRHRIEPMARPSFFDPHCIQPSSHTA